MIRLLALAAVSSALVLSSCATKSGDSCCTDGAACGPKSACSTDGKPGACCAPDTTPAKKKKS